MPSVAPSKIERWPQARPGGDAHAGGLKQSDHAAQNVSLALTVIAHTVGEFGVVLMMGGNIPGKTQVLSMAIYNHVEALEYASAHWLAGGMLCFSFGVLLVLYSRGWNRSP